MPDQDIVERSLKKPWKPACRLFQGDGSAAVVADALRQALAAVVREEGGLPGFEPMWIATSEAAARPDGARTLAAVAREIEQQFGQQPASKVLARALMSNFAVIEAGRALPVARSLAEACLRARVESEFFSKIRHRVVGPAKRFTDASSEQGFAREVAAQLAPAIEKMAQSLVRDPSASNLRSPRSTLRKRSTAELLDAPLRGGGP